eukprot:TRINITY_DN4618_c0_g1_i1.p2 TRINITY_DN4618_c0_g1~~TRINITY_DN4618_c0_g1_i1.p2  ORF type:complete len:162 (+),score=53.43 TRINITY_DN4618_c0_g1_i1:80-565(+)
MSEGKVLDADAHERRLKELEAIAGGLKLNWMTMRDGDSGDKMWQSSWGEDVWEKEQTAEIPKEVLKCRAVTRALCFTSAEEIANLRMVQRVLVQGAQIEEWVFQFGFVIPGSTNEWSSTVMSVEPDEMMPAEAISGHLVMNTLFYDGDDLLRSQHTRCYYV